MTSTEGTWTVLAGGQRGTITTTDQGLLVELGSETTALDWSDELHLQFPTPYSVRVVEADEVRMALGFASTAEAQDFRRAVSPADVSPVEERTAVMPGARPLTMKAPADLLAPLFWLGVAVQLLGGLFVAVFWGVGVGVGVGALLIWAGGIPVLGAVVAWGVKTGIEAGRR